MILSPKKVLELNEKYHLIENLDDREKKNPEGVGFDIRVGEVYKLTGKGFLGVEERSTPAIEKIADVKDGRKIVTLKAHSYVLIRTMEKFNVPGNKISIGKGKKPVYIMHHVYPRGTLVRSGVFLVAWKADPGYSGEYTFGLANMSETDFEFEMGARIANVVFHEVYGDLNRPYGGQWQGGRVAAEKKERQI